MTSELLLPSPQEIADHIPLSDIDKEFISQSRQHISDILSGKDKRLLLILGPCSIHCVEQAVAYAEKLKALIPKIDQYFFPVMRVYYEKSRTAMGWQGLLNDPHLDDSCDLLTGIKKTRHLLKVLTSLRLPIATELVTPLMTPYFEDFISWGSIGARMVTSQIHRQLASSLSMPVGIKNDIFGQVIFAIQALMFATKPQRYLGLDPKGRGAIKVTKGNPFAHLILRGGVDGSNYHQDFVAHTSKTLNQYSIATKIIIDCSHGNADKNHKMQPIVFKDILNQVLLDPGAIAGMMLESNLEEGNQPHPENINASQWGVSLTDPCLSWAQTEELLLEGVKILSR